MGDEDYAQKPKWMFSQKDVADANRNAGLQILDVRRDTAGIRSGDRFWSWANFQLENRLRNWANSDEADAIYLLGAG